jgi:ankyrin repeat protein
VDVNAQSASGNTPLCIAADQGQRETCRILLQHGADANRATHEGVSPLHAAALRDDPEVVRLLIHHGSNLSARTGASPKATPLHFAASRGADAIVTALLEGGADPRVTDETGKTARDVALGQQQDRTASLLADWKGRPTSWFRRLFGS